MSRTGLRHLSLHDCTLRQLPCGPYLAHLESLDLAENALAEMPLALAAATRLRLLHYDAQRINEADAERVLACLPDLMIECYHPPLPMVVEHIRRVAPTVTMQVGMLSSAERRHRKWRFLVCAASANRIQYA